MLVSHRISIWLFETGPSCVALAVLEHYVDCSNSEVYLSASWDQSHLSAHLALRITIEINEVEFIVMHVCA